MFIVKMADNDGNHRCLVEKNVPIVLILSSRWQDGAESLGMDTTSCLYLSCKLLCLRNTKNCSKIFPLVKFRLVNKKSYPKLTQTQMELIGNTNATISSLKQTCRKIIEINS